VGRIRQTVNFLKCFAPRNIQATGGAVTYANGKKIHTFLYNDLTPFEVIYKPSGAQVRYLIQAGGGSGGFGTTRGGGAGGGYTLTGFYSVSEQIYTQSVGAGGIVDVGLPQGENGENSTIFGLTAIGGEKSGRNGYPMGNDGGNGAGAGNGIAGAGGVGLQGFDGGNSTAFSSAAGGAGSTENGGDNGKGGVDANGGDGGEGLESDISGASVVYGSGGSGSGANDSGVPGTSAGKGGISNTTIATSPVQNTGAGGACAYDLGSGTPGANGIIIIAYDWTGEEIDYGIEAIEL